MIRIAKETSLIQAEIIYLCLTTIIGDGSDPRWKDMKLHLIVDATTVGGRTVYRMSESPGDRVVWFGANQVTDGLDVITATQYQCDYVDKRGNIPNINSNIITFSYNQHYEAAKAALSFFMYGDAATL